MDILSGEQIVASDFARRVPSMTVLVATEPILKGTPGSTVVANGMYRATVPRPQQRQVGAISDPAYLRGRASVADIRSDSSSQRPTSRREADDPIRESQPHRQAKTSAER